MLDANTAMRHGRRERPSGAREAPSLTDLLAAFRHQWRLVLACVAVFLACGLAYVVTAPRLYTATANLLIDTRKEDPVQKDRPSADAQVEATALESQSQLLISDAVVTAVVRKLALTKDPEFTEDDSPFVVRALRGLIDRAERWLSPEAENAGAKDPERDVVDRLVRSISAGRSGRSYVLTLSAVSRDPEKAARIANAVTAAYSDDQLTFRLSAVDRSSAWLNTRAAELRRQSLDADREVEAYKRANNIVDTKHGFVKEQQLSDMNSQLVLARAQVAEKRSRLERTQRLDDEGISEPAPAESLANPVIVKLRQQYLDDGRREGELRGRYGADHPAVVALRANMDELKRSMRDEVQRITNSFQTDFRNAKASEEELERNLNRLVEQTGETNRERVQLRALETTAQTYRTLFETFLQQYATILQQQSFPVSTARVITPAKPPKRKSHPRTTLILLGCLGAGLGLGWLGAIAREGLHPTLRDARQAEDATGLPLLGELPEIVHERRRLWRRRGHLLDRVGTGLVGESDPLLQITRLYLRSRFALTMRHVLAALDHANGQGRRAMQSHDFADARVIGVLSAQVGDGKTTVAANLAQLLAKSGRRTVLIDCDIHNPTLTQATQSARSPSSDGTPERPDPARRPEATATSVDPESGLHFVSTDWAGRDRPCPEALCSSVFGDLIEEMRERFDAVVLDLPCLDPMMEARAVADAADGLVVVCAAHRTRTEALARAVERWDAAGMMQVVGFVLNRTRARERRPSPEPQWRPIALDGEAGERRLQAAG